MYIRRLLSEMDQKEFGARERKQKRKLARAEQNAEMHANKAAKKAAAVQKNTTAALQKSSGNSTELVSQKIATPIKDVVKDKMGTAGKLLRKNKKAIGIGLGIAGTAAGLASMIKKEKN